MNAATAMVSLAGLGVRFGAVTALRGVDLRVNRGDFIALVGANGSGKTTLLQALHGMVAHTGSRVVSELAAAQVMVFQRPFVLRLSVWNNLRLALWLAGVPAHERASRAAQALQRAGLMELTTARPVRCRAASSSGSRWRVPGRSAPRCCSSTSRPPTSTRRRNVRSKRCSSASRPTA